MRSPLVVWLAVREAYEEAFVCAKEGGRTDEEAHDIASSAMIDAESALIDDAMNVAKEHFPLGFDCPRCGNGLLGTTDTPCQCDPDPEAK